MCAICDRSKRLGTEAGYAVSVELGKRAHELADQGVDPEQFLLAARAVVVPFVDGFEAWCRQAGEPKCQGTRNQA